MCLGAESSAGPLKSPAVWPKNPLMPRTTHAMSPSALFPLRPVLLATLAACSTLLAGCDYLGIEKPTAEAERKAAEGKAIGSACRQAARALEDCYRYNPKASKAAIFDGWKDMDAYMRENKLDTITPVTPPEPAKPKAAPDAAAQNEDVADEKPAKADAAKADKKAPAAKH